MAKTPLESWIYRKISGQSGAAGPLTRDMIEAYQLRQLKKTIGLAAAKSPFYRRRLGCFNTEKIKTPEDLGEIPFTTPGDIAGDSLRMLCVSQSSINRVVTLHSSGTTGLPKRVFFTAGDQELTRDFFHHGMSTLVWPGDRVLILLPGEAPGSVGDLLAEGLQRMGVRAIPHGFVRNPRKTLEVMERERVTSLVGVPTQVLALACCEPPGQKTYRPGIKNLLLSTDHVPLAALDAIERSWGCTVYNHYGMTEMGLGGGLECRARSGYHLREADLYFEIVDPASGRLQPEGEEGEVVFTTLTRRGMPLIRYRTGDLARFIPDPCPCGTVLKRLARVKERIDGRIALAEEGCLSMFMLDEAFFALEGVIDFRAIISEGNGLETLRLEVSPAAWAGEGVLEAVRMQALSIPAVAKNVQQGLLAVVVVAAEKTDLLPKPCKRMIKDCRRSF